LVVIAHLKDSILWYGNFPRTHSPGCGTDFHKDVVVTTTSGEGIKTETRSYKTFSSSLTKLKEWLLSCL